MTIAQTVFYWIGVAVTVLTVLYGVLSAAGVLSIKINTTVERN